MKTRTAMNAKISVFVICVEAIIHLLLYNLHDCTFKDLCRIPEPVYDYQKLLLAMLTFLASFRLLFQCVGLILDPSKTSIKNIMVQLDMHIE